MKTTLILLMLTLVSCGKDGDNSGASAPSESPAPAAKTPPVSTSYYVSTASQLKECNDSTRGFLAYVQDKSQFQACLDSGWTVVNVNGKDGTNGTNGSNGTPVSPNQWLDAITNQMWVMTNINTTITGWNNSMSACTGSYRMPSPAEIVLALIHGMKASAQAMASPPTFILANDGNPYTLASGSQGSSSVAAQFCIAK